mgnify:CR=1 FL=1
MDRSAAAESHTHAACMHTHTHTRQQSGLVELIYIAELMYPRAETVALKRQRRNVTDRTFINLTVFKHNKIF